jgi:hypothetical protein
LGGGYGILAHEKYDYMDYVDIGFRIVDFCDCQIINRDILV